MAKTSRKKTAVKRTVKKKKSKVAAAKKPKAAAAKKKARKKARKPGKPQTIGERVSSAVKAVMDTFTEAEQLRKKMEQRGSDATE